MQKISFLFFALFMATLAFAQEPATFEDIQLGSNGIWQPPIGSNEMPSGGWLFTNFTENGYWGAFTASNRTDLTQTGLNAQYTAATGCGYDGSSQYAVAYTMGMQTDVYAADGQSHTVTGCYVTNGLWTYEDMVQGGYGEPPYGGYSGNDPDWFKLTATGKNANGQTVGTVDFYLADLRFTDNEDDYILNTWEWFDLSPLGSVATISFSLSSSRGSGYNMITPTYFCMDNFNGVAPGGTDLPPYIANPVQDVVFNEYPQTIQVNLDGVATDPDDPDENITYSIVSNSNPTALNATMSGKILVMTRQNANQATANLTMRATSDGQSVDFNVHVILNTVIDEPPYIVNPVQDVVFNEFPQTIQVNLNGVATDPDDPDENIVYNIVSNSNSSALSATMSNKILVMTRQNANQATADLTMRATSDGQHVDFNVHVINAVIDEPPYIVNPVQDVEFDDFPQTIEINLDGVATDPDDPDENIVYTIVSNPFPEDVSATMNDKIFVLTREANNDADFSIVMRATSDGQHVDFEVHVVMYILESVNENHKAVQVYPNPTCGMVTISVDDALGFEYHIFDFTGKTVLKGKAQDHVTSIDLSDFSKGVYYISAVTETQCLMQKVIVK